MRRRRRRSWLVMRRLVLVMRLVQGFWSRQSRRFEANGGGRGEARQGGVRIWVWGDERGKERCVGRG